MIFSINDASHIEKNMDTEFKADSELYMELQLNGMIYVWFEI